MNNFFIGPIISSDASSMWWAAGITEKRNNEFRMTMRILQKRLKILAWSAFKQLKGTMRIHRKSDDNFQKCQMRPTLWLIIRDTSASVDRIYSLEGWLKIEWVTEWVAKKTEYTFYQMQNGSDYFFPERQFHSTKITPLYFEKRRHSIIRPPPNLNCPLEGEKYNKQKTIKLIFSNLSVSCFLFESIKFKATLKIDDDNSSLRKEMLPSTPYLIRSRCRRENEWIFTDIAARRIRPVRNVLHSARWMTVRR